MKNFYRILQLDSTAITDEIRARLDQCDADSHSRAAAAAILLDPERRRVYDRHWRLLEQVGELRNRLGIRDTPDWVKTGGDQFSPSKPTTQRTQHRTSTENVQRREPPKPFKRPVLQRWAEGQVTWHVYVLLGCVAVGLFIWFHPLPQYYIAAWRDTKEAYQQYVDRFPRTDNWSRAHARLIALSEEDVWQAAWQKSDEALLDALRRYVSTYPSGKYTERAAHDIKNLADNHWPPLIGSRSAPDLESFISKYPESSHVVDAKSQLEALYKDWNWVSSQNTLDAYRRYLSFFPESKVARAKIIDLEVDEIAKGDHAPLPPSPPTRISGGVFAGITITNETGHTLTVRYSGLDSDSVVIPKGEIARLRLRAGQYRVAASVDAWRVRNYFGVDQLQAGDYDVRFYIQTGR